MSGECVRIEERLLLLLAGELSPDAVASVENHVASCSDCQRKRASLEGTNELLRRAWVPAPTADEWKALVDKARAAPRIVELPSLLRKRSLGLAAALLALLVPATLYVLLEPYRPPVYMDMDPAVFETDL